MSWSFQVQAPDGSFEATVRARFSQERKDAYHTPASRRALVAIEEFVLGAAKTAPQGTSFEVTTSGHLEGDHSSGEARVHVRFGPTLAGS